MRYADVFLSTCHPNHLASIDAERAALSGSPNITKTLQHEKHAQRHLEGL